MYLIKTYIAPSAIEGIGVFAGEDISKGTEVWKYIENFDKKFSCEEFDLMTGAIKQFVEKHAFWAEDGIYLCGDYGLFTNHADTPNTGHNSEKFSEVALKDIKKGEELTCDYKSFDKSAEKKLKAD